MAIAYNISPKRILKYNEIDSEHKIKAGDIIYLQPKKRNAKALYHIVGDNESLWQISQKYGIKKKFIIKYNGYVNDGIIEKGRKLKLKGALMQLQND